MVRATADHPFVLVADMELDLEVVLAVDFLEDTVVAFPVDTVVEFPEDFLVDTAVVSLADMAVASLVDVDLDGDDPTVLIDAEPALIQR